MKDWIRDRRKRAYLSSAVIAGLGLAASVFIYLTANTSAEDLPWELTHDTKRKLREIEMVGGKANVIAYQFSEWFGGLWHGRNLAYTIAVLAVAVAACYLWISLRASEE